MHDIIDSINCNTGCLDSHANHVDNDNHEVQNQHHNEALRMIDRMTNGNIKSWLILDNADDNVNIEMKQLNLISNGIDVIDTTSNMDIITRLFVQHV